MSELIEIILQAVDNASSVFSSVTDSVTGMADSLSGTADTVSSDFTTMEENVSGFQTAVSNIDSSSIDELANELGMSTEEVERLIETGANLGSIPFDMAAAEADNLAQSIDNIETEAQESGEAMDAMSSLMSFQEISGYVNQLADAMWDMADTAGTVSDSVNRASLEAEGFGISADSMKTTVSELAASTGRSAGEIRESFINATAKGITNLDSFKQMMQGAGAQAYLLGTDIDSMATKFSNMAARSSIMERGLASTGITVEELGNVLGIQGATIDEVNAKWETMDTNARAAALGQAAAMNEGKNANQEYQNSWEGLNKKIDIAKAKLETMVGNVLLPVLVPALDAAGRILGWFGDTLNSVMDGPLGGFISVIGSLAAGLILALGAITVVSAGMGFFEASLLPAIAASWALMAPWLPWIALGAAIVAVIYEIGKAFGWWDDASGMLDAISAGLNRLWEAFINNPDVQAFITALNEAWTALSSAVQPAIDAVLSFFGVNMSGNFDIVRALIDAIGFAWNAITAPIRLVIGLIWQVISVFQSLVSGQISLQQAIILIWGAITGFWSTILTRLASLLLSAFSKMVNNAKQKAQAIVTGVITYITTLPSRMSTQLLKGVTSIVNAGSKWVSHAKTEAGKVVSGVSDKLSGIGGSITSALSGVINAFTKPFKDAYDAVAKWVGKIKSKASEVPVIGGAFGGEDLPLGGAYGGEDLTSTQVRSIERMEIHTSNDVNLSLDLKNVPNNIDENVLRNALVESLTDKSVLSVLVNNNDFQSLDSRAKNRILARNNRARGV